MSRSGDRAPHPVVWFVLILPFGVLGGFVGVALTFLATRHGMSITEGALLGSASMLSQWLKWLWAPAVDITLSPRRWYVLGTVVTALGVLAMSALPLTPATLGLLLAVIAITSLVNTVTAMAVEASIAATTTAAHTGRVSAWFQAGNLGGVGMGGGLGLALLETLPAPWMAGAVMALLIAACMGALAFTPVFEREAPRASAGAAVRWAVADLMALLRTAGGLRAALLFMLPIGTGAAGGVLTQAAVAEHWGAGATEVALVQGVLAGLVTAAGCFAGGWLCERRPAPRVYVGTGLAMALIAVALALAPATVPVYVGGALVYNFALGVAYAAFTAVALQAIGAGAAATKYNVMASLSNFPIWWMGLLLGWVADLRGPTVMLGAEATLGVLGAGLFAFGAARLRDRGPAA